jgi:hypothetical protein
VLGGLQLGLETFGHLRWRWAGQAEVDLDRVVDEPLESRQCTNHDNPGRQTTPHTCASRTHAHVNTQSQDVLGGEQQTPS